MVRNDTASNPGNGWLYGTLEGGTMAAGWFPQSYVHPLPSASTTIPMAGPPCSSPFPSPGQPQPPMVMAQAAPVLHGGSPYPSPLAHHQQQHQQQPPQVSYNYPTATLVHEVTEEEGSFDGPIMGGGDKDHKKDSGPPPPQDTGTGTASSSSSPRGGRFLSKTGSALSRAGSETGSAMSSVASSTGRLVSAPFRKTSSSSNHNSNSPQKTVAIQYNTGTSSSASSFGGTNAGGTTPQAAGAANNNQSGDGWFARGIKNSSIGAYCGGSNKGTATAPVPATTRTTTTTTTTTQQSRGGGLFGRGAPRSSTTVTTVEQTAPPPQQQQQQQQRSSNNINVAGSVGTYATFGAAMSLVTGNVAGAARYGAVAATAFAVEGNQNVKQQQQQ